MVVANYGGGMAAFRLETVVSLLVATVMVFWVLLQWPTEYSYVFQVVYWNGIMIGCSFEVFYSSICAQLV